MRQVLRSALKEAERLGKEYQSSVPGLLKAQQSLMEQFNSGAIRSSEAEEHSISLNSKAGRDYRGKKG